VYSQQPTGFVDSEHPDYVCLLSKCLYGLRQAPRPCGTAASPHICAPSASSHNRLRHIVTCAPPWLRDGLAPLRRRHCPHGVIHNSHSTNHRRLALCVRHEGPRAITLLPRHPSSTHTKDGFFLHACLQ
jgi:hypothetical protein